MPPWDADPGYGPWLNDISLSDDEIAAITRWSANGAPRGEGDEPVHELPATDRSRIGLWFAEPEDIEKEVITLPVWNAGIHVPAGDPNYEAEASRVFEEDVELRAFTPHMHYRGKSMHFSAELPDGSARDLLRVSRYDFNWQTTYQLAEPIRLPAGSRVRVKAVFDNSADNPSNPDPTVDVRWGLESTDEMLNGLVDYVAADG
jgi:hypothetical protein